MTRGQRALAGDSVSVSHGVYDHFGIVTDRVVNGWPTVISSSKRQGRVVEETWDEFAAGAPVRHRGYPSPLPRHAVVARARSQIGRPFSLFRNNCEHFATRVQGLVPHSSQLFALGAVAVGVVLAAGRE